MVESSDKMWSIGEGNGKPLQYSCLENPMNSMKRPKEVKDELKDELPRLVGAQYAAGKEWRNSSTKCRACIPLFSYSSPARLSHTRHLYSRPFTVFILSNLILLIHWEIVNVISISQMKKPKLRKDR